MTEWTVVGVLVVLIGLFLTVGKPILNLVTQLQGLRYDTDRQEKEIDRDIESIKELVKVSQSHEIRITNQESETDKLAASIAELVKLNADHEGRIVVLEKDVDVIKSKGD